MNTLTLTCVAHKRERERVVAGEGGGSVFWFYLLSFFWGIYIEEAFAGFFPLGFSQDKYLCSFFVVVLVYISVIWLMVMLL